MGDPLDVHPWAEFPYKKKLRSIFLSIFFLKAQASFQIAPQRERVCLSEFGLGTEAQIHVRHRIIRGKQLEISQV
jgi:hypothetical protein